MSKTIEIKGKTYDAVTGQIVIDAVKPPVKKSTTTSTTKKHTPKPSQTLMRSAVKKPNETRISVQGELQSTTVKPKIVRSKPAAKIDKSRLERSKAVSAHANIKRFYSPEARPTLPTSFAPINVRLTPVEQKQRTQSVDTRHDDMFMNAIANANHHVDIKKHAAKHRSKTRHHYASMVAGVCALLVITLFAWYLNNPSPQLRVAGIQAGVYTMNPDFNKAGFAFAGVRAENSQRIINLTSKTSAANYQLSQQTTNWDGQTMVKNISSVAADGMANYTTLQTGKNTIYKFGDKQATWVKDGTWYNLSGERPIDDDQLKALVNNS